MHSAFMIIYVATYHNHLSKKVDLSDIHIPRGLIYIGTCTSSYFPKYFKLDDFYAEEKYNCYLKSAMHM